MKHILNDLSEEEKNAIREQHTGGMKIMNENFSKLVNSTLGDVKPLISEQQVDTGEQNTHRYDRGEQSPGIEKFLQNPLDATISNGLLNELRNDPYGRGKIVIIFNGEKFKEPGAFMFKIQSDFKAGKCYTLTNYDYNNRFILNTQIKMTANIGECKKDTTPVKTNEPDKTNEPVKTTDPIKKTIIPKPKPKVKKSCKFKLQIPQYRKFYKNEVIYNGSPWDKDTIIRFQKFCSSNPKMWKRQYSDNTTSYCSSKDVDGIWGCCSQTCYETYRNNKYSEFEEIDIRKGNISGGDTDNSKNIPGTECPKSVNCAPGPGQRDSICKNTKTLQMCERLGTKVYY